MWITYVIPRGDRDMNDITKFGLFNSKFHSTFLHENNLYFRHNILGDYSKNL